MVCAETMLISDRSEIIRKWRLLLVYSVTIRNNALGVGKSSY
jgi:hypothetical protein